MLAYNERTIETNTSLKQRQTTKPTYCRTTYELRNCYESV